MRGDTKAPTIRSYQVPFMLLLSTDPQDIEHLVLTHRGDGLVFQCIHGSPCRTDSKFQSTTLPCHSMLPETRHYKILKQKTTSTEKPKAAKANIERLFNLPFPQRKQCNKS